MTNSLNHRNGPLGRGRNTSPRAIYKGLLLRGGGWKEESTLGQHWQATWQGTCPGSHKLLHVFFLFYTAEISPKLLHSLIQVFPRHLLLALTGVLLWLSPTLRSEHSWAAQTALQTDPASHRPKLMAGPTQIMHSNSSSIVRLWLHLILSQFSHLWQVFAYKVSITYNPRSATTMQRHILLVIYLRDLFLRDCF